MTVSVRVGHAEREQALAQLKSAYTEGQLDSADLSERTQRALEARTRADLEALLIDLPAPAASVNPCVPLLSAVSQAISRCLCCCKPRK